MEKIIIEKQRPYSEPTSPRIVFKSDKLEQTIMNLETFLKLFSQEILPAAINGASNEGLDLRDDLFKDLEITNEFIQVLSQRA